MNPTPLPTRQEIVGVLPPPAGVRPNFENPESIGHHLVIVIAIFLPFASLVVALRIYTRRVIVNAIAYDDYAIILGWLLSIALSITRIVNLHYGLGVHMWDLPITTFGPAFWIITLIEGTFYGLSFMFVKMSLLLLYLRLSQYPTFRIMVYMVMVTTVMYSLLGSFQFLFNCRPIAKNWDITITYGSCIEMSKIFAVHGGLNIATDIAMLILPVIMVRKLQLPRREKVALAGLFMTGTLVCIVSIIRLKKVLFFISTADITWFASDVMIWTTIEVNVGIICACLPSFKPFLRRHFPRVLGNRNPS
ncbi:hypothetical protein BKA61DRAFT_204051 [Leptodontidium sp. MPI-SDFR-AT-0119]|nr:hypothetical protein BKA61DRAFT_204051 [Leptodontidium sp. MPI-SDFR-AT-0119]